MADINEVIVRGSAAGFAQEILAGRRRLTADEPLADGGADTGPTPPYDLLLAPQIIGRTSLSVRWMGIERGNIVSVFAQKRTSRVISFGKRRNRSSKEAVQ
jgi:hypothetical protein